MIDNGLRSSTKRTYSSAQTKYLAFCNKHKLEAIPGSESTILRYLAFLQTQTGKGKMGLRHGTMQVHLAALKNLFVSAGFDSDLYTPRIRLALRSVQIRGPPPQVKKPITFGILKAMINRLAQNFDSILWSALLCTSYYGCYRGG